MELAYEKANRTNVKENIELLLKILEEAEFNQKWINEYKQDMINYLKEKHKTNNLFPVQFAQDILLVLKQIDNKAYYLNIFVSSLNDHLNRFFKSHDIPCSNIPPPTYTHTR